MTGEADREALIDDALRILLRRARTAKVVLDSEAQRALLREVADHLALEDRMAADLLMPRSERRRQVLRVADRLEGFARRGRRFGGPNSLSERATGDIRIVLPSFSTDALNPDSPEEATALAAQLRAAVSILDAKSLSGRSRGFYGAAEGRRQGDTALHAAAADLLDLLNVSRGCPTGTLQPATIDGPWHELVRLIASAGGRPDLNEGETVRGVLEAVHNALPRKDEPPPRRSEKG